MYTKQHGKIYIEVPTKFHHMTEYFGTEKIDLLLRKQIYPYEYLDSECKFTEEQLPPKEAFDSTLSGENISVEYYVHAQCAWKDFNIQNLGQYHDLYVLTDVLSLADVFEITMVWMRLISIRHQDLPGKLS
jgi:hypothetical protein